MPHRLLEPRPASAASGCASSSASRQKSRDPPGRRSGSSSAGSPNPAPRADERTRELADARDAAATADAATARVARSSRLWEHDFPMPISAVGPPPPRYGPAAPRTAAIAAAGPPVRHGPPGR